MNQEFKTDDDPALAPRIRQRFRFHLIHLYPIRQNPTNLVSPIPFPASTNASHPSHPTDLITIHNRCQPPHFIPTMTLSSPFIPISRVSRQRLIPNPAPNRSNSQIFVFLSLNAPTPLQLAMLCVASLPDRVAAAAAATTAAVP